MGVVTPDLRVAELKAKGSVCGGRGVLWKGGGVLCFGRIQWSVDIKGMHMFCSTLPSVMFPHTVGAY